MMADFLKDIGIIEKYGTGIKRIIDYCLEAGLPQPSFTNISDGFMVTVYSSLKTYIGKSSEKSSEIFSLIAGEPHITIVSIARQLNISTRMVEKYLAKLTSEGKIVRVSGRKNGHLEITG